MAKDFKYGIRSMHTHLGLVTQLIDECTSLAKKPNSAYAHLRMLATRKLLIDPYTKTFKIGSILCRSCIHCKDFNSSKYTITCPKIMYRHYSGKVVMRKK